MDVLSVLTLSVTPLSDMTVLENVIILLPELVSLGSKTLAPPMPPVERPRMPDVEGASERGRRDARGHSKTARYDDGEKGRRRSSSARI